MSFNQQMPLFMYTPQVYGYYPIGNNYPLLNYPILPQQIYQMPIQNQIMIPQTPKLVNIKQEDKNDYETQESISRDDSKSVKSNKGTDSKASDTESQSNLKRRKIIFTNEEFQTKKVFFENDKYISTSQQTQQPQIQQMQKQIQFIQSQRQLQNINLWNNYQNQLNQELKNINQNENNQQNQAKPVESEESEKKSNFHNMTKLFFNNLLQLFTTENIIDTQLPFEIQKKIIQCIQIVKNSGKRKDLKIQKTDLFNHSHYNLLFLTLNKHSVSIMRKKEKDIKLHQECFGIDLRDEIFKEENNELLQKINLIKKCNFEIIMKNWEKMPTQNKSNRIEYWSRAQKGIKSLSQGIIIQRF